MEKQDGYRMKQLALFSLFLFPILIVAQSHAGLDESFDPTSLSDWGNSKARVEKVRALSEHLAHLDADTGVVEILEEAPFIFRVQLASTRDMERASAIEEHALQVFEEEVIVHFDSPFYKIRVGKMENREDAQNLQRKAMETGYRRSWVIRTVNTPVQKDRIEEDVRTQ